MVVTAVETHGRASLQNDNKKNKIVKLEFVFYLCCQK